MKLHVETAGTLPALIGKSQKNRITELTLTGNLNGTDIRFIREMAGSDKYFRVTNGNLAVLDMTGATVVSGGNCYAFNEHDCLYYYTKDHSISVHMFSKCNRLTFISLPDTATEIDYSAFAYCYGLKELVISEKNADYSIVDGVLFSKDQKTLLWFPKDRTGAYAIPEGVTGIGIAAFSRCALKEIEIPDSVTIINDHAFYKCSQLKSIALPDKLVDIGAHNVNKCPELTSISIGGNLSNIYPCIFRDCKKLKEFTVSEKNENFSASDGVLYNKYKTTLLRYPSAKTSSRLVIPSGVIKIEDFAFESCLNLKKITFPATMIDFGDFKHCGDLEMIYSKKVKPYDESELDMSLRYSPLSNVNQKRCKLYVPKGSSIAYRKDVSWNGFEFIIEAPENGTPIEIDDSCILRYVSDDSGKIEFLENTVSFQLYNYKGKPLKPSMFSKEYFLKGSRLSGAYALIKAGNQIINQLIMFSGKDFPF